jgi:hypothetical protein
MCCSLAVSVVPTHTIQIGFRIAGIVLRSGSGSTGVFPLGFRWQFDGLLRLIRKFCAEVLSVAPRHHFHRSVIAFEMAGIRPDDSLILFLSYFILPHVIRHRNRNWMCRIFQNSRTRQPAEKTTPLCARYLFVMILEPERTTQAEQFRFKLNRVAYSIAISLSDMASTMPLMTSPNSC